jgi:hypothetical protein
MHQLTEQHRHQLSPATEALRCPFGPVLLHQRRELQTREVLTQLIRQAHYLILRIFLYLEHLAVYMALNWSRREFKATCRSGLGLVNQSARQFPGYFSGRMARHHLNSKVKSTGRGHNIRVG